MNTIPSTDKSRIKNQNTMEYLSNANANNFRYTAGISPSLSTPANAAPRTHMGVQGKKSFLVFKHNKYMTIPTESIALFYIKFDSLFMICFDKQEYRLNYSLEQLQQLLCETQFFRLNRQYLINFTAIKEVEHYFARKLLVKPIISIPEKLLVSKEKATSLLRWLENR